MSKQTRSPRHVILLLRLLYTTATSVVGQGSSTSRCLCPCKTAPARIGISAVIHFIKYASSCPLLCPIDGAQGLEAAARVLPQGAVKEHQKGEVLRSILS